MLKLKNNESYQTEGGYTCYKLTESQLKKLKPLVRGVVGVEVESDVGMVKVMAEILYVKGVVYR